MVKSYGTDSHVCMTMCIFRGITFDAPLQKFRVQVASLASARGNFPLAQFGRVLVFGAISLVRAPAGDVIFSTLACYIVGAIDHFKCKQKEIERLPWVVIVFGGEDFVKEGVV